jgi:hypothetical protein
MALSARGWARYAGHLHKFLTCLKIARVEQDAGNKERQRVERGSLVAADPCR